MQTLPSGIQKPEGTDNATRVNLSRNDDLLDFLLRPYIEEVDTTTYDATSKVYTTVRYKRPEDNATAIQCVLSNKDENGNYLTDTWTLNAPGGTIVRTWTLTYDTLKNVVSKVYADS